MLKSTVKFNLQREKDPLTVLVPGTDPATVAAERRAHFDNGTALENQLPKKQKPRRYQLLGSIITITFPPQPPKQP
ncbi:MAG: hypothetical protein UU09_C0040G0005 [Microgenomates group bacterium GW2011_GWA2_40_6]|nr:MAG: hypothetical protein UU09_C0040G0005 [Microgenomates group bacterium GW2011_GWA2_40_6]